MFNGTLFFYFLLPPIVFAEGYNLKKRKFFQNFPYIIIFGVLGTLATFGLILGLSDLVNELGIRLSAHDSGLLIRGVLTLSPPPPSYSAA